MPRVSVLLPVWNAEATLATALSDEGRALRSAGRAAEAVAPARQAVATKARLVEGGHGGDPAKVNLGIMRQRLGLALEGIEDARAACAVYREAAAVVEGVPDAATLLADLARRLESCAP